MFSMMHGTRALRCSPGWGSAPARATTSTTDLDEAAALAAQEQAERILADRAADVDEARAWAEFAQAAAQLRAIRRVRGRR